LTKGDKKAQLAINFINQLKHTKGKWANVPFNLRPWQIEDIIKPIFGRLKADGNRIVRTVYVEIPRKNGKSELAAAVGLFLLFADNEIGAEIYVAAGDRDQASLVFNVAAQMVRMRKPLATNCKIIDSQKRIVRHDKGSFLRAISAEAYTKFGFNASGIIFDELHVQPNRDLWDALTTSTSAREQPLTFAITTAGFDRESVCWEQHAYAEKVRDGIIDDPTFLPVLYTADRDEDWTDPEVWHRCNPALGDFRSFDEMEHFCKKAQEIPALENTFRRLYLNQWTSQEVRWLPMAMWDKCRGKPISEKRLKGRTCYAGLDLATVYDLTALVMVFPDDDGETFTIVPRFWIPEEGMKKRSDRDRVPYDQWVADGLIEATPGATTDYRWVIAEIERCMTNFDLKEIAYDRWGAPAVVQQLDDLGFEDEKSQWAPRHLIQFGQGYKSFSPPTKELMKLVLERKLRHGGHKVLRWNADNLVVRQDPAGNVKPDKEKSTEKIDGVVAMIMGLDRALRAVTETSVYELHGDRAGKLLSLEPETD
jgi:phage terminase large subunit-like protein